MLIFEMTEGSFFTSSVFIALDLFREHESLEPTQLFEGLVDELTIALAPTATIETSVSIK